MENIVEVVHQLQDHELALLLSFIAREHVIFTTDGIGDFEELQDTLVKSFNHIFDISNNNISILRFDADLSPDDFSSAFLIKNQHKYAVPGMSKHSKEASKTEIIHQILAEDDVKPLAIPEILICQGLHLANHQIQTKVVDLIRSRRYEKDGVVYTAPSTFLVAALLPNEVQQLAISPILLDNFFISHNFHPDDVDREELVDDDLSSSASIIVKKPSNSATTRHLVPAAYISQLRVAASKTYISAEVKRYMADLVVFLRMHRAVRSGVSAAASRHYDSLVKCLAPLHGQNFVTPALSALAAYKIYSHRIKITTPDEERSMAWGSDRRAVKQMLDNFNVELIIDSVIKEVRPPS